MNIENFRNDLKRALSASGISQCELASMAGVRQGTLSKFLNGNRDRDMKLSVAMRLWPFVYGCDFTPAQPATSPAPAQAQPAAQ